MANNDIASALEAAILADRTSRLSTNNMPLTRWYSVIDLGAPSSTMPQGQVVRDAQATKVDVDIDLIQPAQTIAPTAEIQKAKVHVQTDPYIPPTRVTSDLERFTNEQAATSDAKERLSYNNGFGDLCFGRLLDGIDLHAKATNAEYLAPRDMPLPDPKQASTAGTKRKSPKEILIEDPKRAPRVWADDAKLLDAIMSTMRQGNPFPFTDLPLIIRQKVYDNLLQPLLCYNKTDKYVYIPLLLEREMFLGHPVLEDIESESINCAAVYSPAMAAAHRKARLKRFERNHYFLYMNEIHPGRGGSYTLRASEPVSEHRYHSQYDESCSVNIYFLEWLRQLSNVSTAVRIDLATYIWPKVRLTARRGGSNGKNDVNEVWNTPPIALLNRLCVDRPMAAENLQNLDLAVSIRHFGTTNAHLRDDCIEQFKDDYHLVAQCLKLRTLRVQLKIRCAQYAVLFTDETLLDTLSVISTFQVSEKLTVDFVLYFNEDYSSKKVADEFRPSEEHQKATAERLATLWMSSELRQKLVDSEEARLYLETRLD